jgi:hypothetical protein
MYATIAYGSGIVARVLWHSVSPAGEVRFPLWPNGPYGAASTLRFQFPDLPWDQQAAIIGQRLDEHQTNIYPDTDEDISLR